MQTTAPPQNPFRKPETKPDWAQLTRLGGDRVAILFEDLRARVGRLVGLTEELHYGGTEWGWTPRYRLGNETIFTVHLLPGILEATVEVDAARREKLLASTKLAAGVKAVIRDASPQGGATRARFRLSNGRAVRSFAKFVLMISKFIDRKRP